MASLLSLLAVLASSGVMVCCQAEESELLPIPIGPTTTSERISTPSGFLWGEPELGRMETLDGHVDRFDPWHPVASLRNRQAQWGRHIGMGDPLIGTSWRNRPLYAGWLFGELYGDDLTAGRAEQRDDLVGGYRLGWDFDHYWGTEARFAFSNVEFVDDSDSSIRDAENTYWDINLLYYPWGDARWRPFASLGMGWGGFSYTLSDGQAIDKTLFTLPIAGGVKYYFQRWLALRLTLTDNWAFGQGPLNTMHNVSLTADVEVRFGGHRTSYSPYGGSIHMW